MDPLDPVSQAADGQSLLVVRGVGKSFGATRALDDVTIEIRPGSVHGFVGENGAGKSTLGKIIAGVFPPDQGELVLRGAPVAFGSPREALAMGIACVGQEVALVPHRTVAENVFLGAEPRRAGFVDGRTLLTRFARLTESSGFELQAQARVARLSLAQQQQVEILRALARDAELIVLDEASASLAATEVDHLHGIVRSLRARGHTVILVSHFLNEVLDLADTVTILRDGKVVRTGPTADESEGSLLSAMLGRPASRAYPDKVLPAPDRRPVLTIEGLTTPGVHNVSLSIGHGEIVGLAGLIGAGRTELARAIYGSTPGRVGDVRAGDVRLPDSPAGSLRAGVVLIPESRKDDGLLLRRTVRENVSIASLRSLQRFGLVRRTLERRRVADSIRKAAGSAPLEAPAGSLSGGNQQKLLFARALLAKPRVLIADDPTRGIDVGAKREIYDLLVGLAAEGVGIMLISNEIEEILGLAHRVLVMRAGRLVAELEGEAMTEEAILTAAFGTSEVAA